MTIDLHLIKGIGKKTAQRMKEYGIDSVERLASSNVKDLLKINGIGISTANKYIRMAEDYLVNKKGKQEEESIISEDLDLNPLTSEDILDNSSPFSSEEINYDPPTTSSEETNDVPKNPIPEERLNFPKPSIFEEMLDVLKPHLSEDILNVPNPFNTEELLEGAKPSSNKSKPLIPIKSYVALKDEKISITQKELSQFVNSKSKSKEKKTFGKKKKHLLPKENDTFYQKSNYSKPQIAQTQQITSKRKEITPQNNLKVKEEVKERKVPLKTFFPEETMQRIRFLHFKIKHLEEALHKKEKFSFNELNYVVDYIEILNINYKTQSQIQIFKELNITPSFYDPIENREIQIWDLMYECTRVLWVAAQACSFLSKKFKAENAMKNAIVAMVECSKMYKAAAYFSIACTRQEDMGTTLFAENLELNSEESRILAQNLCIIREEKNENLSMLPSLYSGLSALTKRLYFLKRYDKIRENQLKAQYNYDIGKACHLKSKYLSLVSGEFENEEPIENLLKKANYYFYKAEETWEDMLENLKELTKTEKENIRTNLSIVNEDIMENDVEIIKQSEAMKILDPEPLIIIPENLAPFIPRTTIYLTEYKPKDLNYDSYKRYKDLISEISIDYNKLEELQNKKAGIGRTLKQLTVLYDNNDIDIGVFTSLFEKYSTKLAMVDKIIEKLKHPDKIGKKQVKETKSRT